MKYPEDFLKERKGPTSRLGKEFHALKSEGMASSKIRNGNVLTSNKLGFYEAVEKKTDYPQICLWWSSEDGVGDLIHLAQIDLDGSGSEDDTELLRLPRLGAPSASIYSGRLKYVGDGFVTAVFGDGNSYPSPTTSEELASWPNLIYVPGPIEQRLSSEPSSVAPGVSYIDSLLVYGLMIWYMAPEMYATGWDAGLESYRYSFSCSLPLDAAHATDTCSPAFWYADTESQEFTQTAVPYFPGRNHQLFRPCVIGPGKLQALMFVKEDTDEVQIPPYFVTSNDHGQTWSFSYATFLNDKLYSHPATTGSTPVRAYYDGVQNTWMSWYCINFYIGNGKNLLIILNCFDHMDGATPRYRAMAFLGTGGSSYTRISWPADDWDVDASGVSTAPLATHIFLAFMKPDDLNAHFSFGTGCCHIPIQQAGVRKLLVTYDFGSSWHILPYPAVPASVTGTRTAITGAPIKPYINVDDPGEILFAFVDHTGGKITILQTTGLFDAFKVVGEVKHSGAIAINNPQLAGPAGDYNEYICNFAASKKDYIFPAFPGEFDKP